MAAGSVKFFNQTRGYGFIIPESGDKDIFLHITSLRASKIAGPVNEGDKFSFEIEVGPRGPNAVKLARV